MKSRIIVTMGFAVIVGAQTAPYMHDGRFKTLEEVVNFYNNGGIKNPHQDNTIIPLELTEEDKKDLVSFLRSLSGEGWQQIAAPKRFPQRSVRFARRAEPASALLGRPPQTEQRDLRALSHGRRTISVG